MSPVYSFQRGTSPLLVSIPHAGTSMPEAIGKRLTRQALQLPDTDWYVDRLYHWVVDQGVGLLVANYSRYVIDLNRPPDNAALYAGPGTGLLPEQLFDGGPLYRSGTEPSEEETKRRLSEFWQPYHQSLPLSFSGSRQNSAMPFCWMRTRYAVKSPCYLKAGCRI